MSRGVHRGVYASLSDDPDFQRLSPDARLSLYTARLCKQAGPAVIFRYYPELLMAQTGLPARRLETALAELERARWIEREGVVLWVRNGLRHDPTMRLSNRKHRAAVERAISELPKCQLVLTFCNYYGIAKPFDSLSSFGPPNTEEDRGTTRTIPNHPEPTRVPSSVTAQPSPADAGAGREAWAGYSTAYQRRYGVEPVRNAKVNSQLKQLVLRLGTEDAPAVAAWYVTHNAALYVRAGHAVDLLLRDAEKLRTEWATDRPITETAARSADQHEERGAIAHRLLKKAERQGESSAQA